MTNLKGHNMTAYNVTTSECLRNDLPTDAVILDVRTDIEHRECCLSCKHVHIPLDQLSADSLKAKAKMSADTPVYILCKAGPRAHAAAQRLCAEGYHNVHVMEGGMMLCQQMGLPLRKGENVLSLERQVRIAAGALVLVGFVLGLLVHPFGHILSGLIGAGLIFAGVTNWCGMALLLAKAPWNR
jgi:rhodanese-related sulfurtransferase